MHQRRRITKTQLLRVLRANLDDDVCAGKHGTRGEFAPPLHAKPLTSGELLIAPGTTHSTPPAMILLRGLSLVALLLCAVIAKAVNPPDCSDSRDWYKEPCTQPIGDVVDVTPGSFYAAKIRCYDCPHLDWVGEGKDRERKLVPGDVDLVCSWGLR